MENYDQARDYFGLASAISSEYAERYSYLSEAEGGTARAGEAAEDFGIVRFVDREE